MGRKPYVYKVVSNWKKTTQSGSSNFVRGGLCLRYRMGKQTKAPKGTAGIFCFERYKDAVTHLKDDCFLMDSPLAILKCLYTGEIASVNEMFVVRVGTINNCRSRADAIAAIARRGFMPTSSLPLNTRTVESVTPISVKFVQPGE